MLPIPAALLITSISFTVTNTSDSGAGSLRDAIEQVNESADCMLEDPCAIVFKITGAPAPNGVYTISPLTALPALRRPASIDGATQRRFGGDTNPAGPEMEINGALCGNCNGLEVRAGAGEVKALIRELTINGFMADGVVVAGVTGRIDGCYIGTDPTGSRSIANGRGISVENAAYDIGAVFDNRIGGRPATGCVISGNAGDAIVISGGHSNIEGNLIGTDRTGFVPLANGGNGIRSSGSSAVQENTIAFNRDRGVVVLQPALVNSLFANRIHSNRSLGIDIGGDGLTPNGTPGVEDAPVIISARMTGGATAVRFRAPLPPPGVVLSTAVSFYSVSFTDASGAGEGRSFLATTNIFRDQPQDDYEIVLPANLAGKYLTATATLFDGFNFLGAGTTSEFSGAVQVTAGSCPEVAPQLLSVQTSNGATTFRWSHVAAATEYRLWMMQSGDEPRIAYRGGDNQVTLVVAAGGEFWVEARFDPCYGTQSEHRVVQ